MKKPLIDRITKKQKDLVLVQGRVPRELFDKVKKYLKEDNIEWQQLVQAALKQYIDER